MLDLLASAKFVADALTAAGVPAVTDSRELVVPGAIVAPGPLTFDSISRDSAEVEWQVIVVVPDNGPEDALIQLSAQLAKVGHLIGNRVEFDFYDLPNHGGTLPVALCTTPVRITED